MTDTREGTVYALIDPRDQKIRYIGKTEKPILTRLAGHLGAPTNPAMRVWINALAHQGIVPRIEPVATAPVARLDAEERRQIGRHATMGHRLFNAPYYHQHLADLGQQPSGPRQHPPVPGQALARAAYGRLAVARAGGRVPAWMAGLLVVAGAPLYLAALIVRALLRALLATTLGLAVTLAAAGGWILWDAGFDRAARDLLLPHLPEQDWPALWGTYLAEPLATLAVGAAGPYVVTSVVLAGMAYAEMAEAAGVERCG